MAHADVPRWTVTGDPILSHFTTTLSAVFPPGEEFFIATVRQNRSAIGGDKVLGAQVKAFIGQEAMHGREHRKLNATLDELGYRATETEAGVGRVLDALHRLRPASLPLAVTAASEHLTGIMGEVVLSDPDTLEVLFPDPAMRTLLAWHALEEMEHKSVAFDVLERTGAGYVVRMAGFGLMAVALGGYVVLAWTRGVVRDRRHIGMRELRQAGQDLRKQKLLSFSSLAKVLRYARPGFHPDDMGTAALAVEWSERLRDRTTVTAGMAS
jgi:hypothetical protein